MFPPISDMPMFKKRFLNLNSRIASDNGITLPSPPCMTKSQIQRVCSEVVSFLRSHL